MAETVTNIGYGDTLEWSTDGGTTWNSVTEVKAVGLPVNSVEKIEATHMASPNRTKEYVLGLRDATDVEFTFNFNSTDYQALYTLEANGTDADWRHTLALEQGASTAAVFEYSGGVDLNGGTREVNGITEVTASIRRTGAATFTAAT